MRQPPDLERFLAAQFAVYDQVLRELRDGRKTSHWMWFIFPQLRGLGRSAMAHTFGLTVVEASAYAAHAVLGLRLRECTACVLATNAASAGKLFGSPDDMKLRSCMTLFDTVAPDVPLFGQVLLRFFQGQRDERTLGMLDADSDVSPDRSPARQLRRPP